MFKWIKDKCKSIGKRVLDSSPPPVQEFKEKYPKTFWLIVVVAIIIPMGLTVLLFLNWLLGWPLWWLFSFFKWLGLVS